MRKRKDKHFITNWPSTPRRLFLSLMLLLLLLLLLLFLLLLLLNWLVL